MCITSKKIFVLICLWILGLTAEAQQAKSYLFSRFARENGLAADQAYAVAQDRQGYIWIATEQGLQRYDGTRFLTFRHNPADPGSIPLNGVGGLHVDKKGRLWVLFFGNRVGIFNTSNFRYKASKLVVPDEFKRNNMQRFAEDEDGTLRISIQGYGLMTYNELKNEFSAAYNLIRPADGSVVTDINNTKTKGRYLVISAGGVDEFDTVTRQWMPRNSHSFLKLLNLVKQEENALGPNHLFIDNKGRTWCDVWLDGKKNQGPQVYAYDPSGNSVGSYKESIDNATKGYHSINGFLQQKNGDIWLYGTSLFARFNETDQRFEDCRNESLKVNGIDLETIYNLFEDKDGNIWLSGTNGLFMFNPGRQVFTHIHNRRIKSEPVYTNSVDAVLQSKSGVIYASTWGAGIFSYDTMFNIVSNPVITNPKENNGFAGWDMHERANGEIWIAMQGGSIRVFDPKTKKTAILKLSVFENRTVRQVVEDSSGNMWMGTQYGTIIKCTGANWRDTAGSFKIVQRLKGRITKLVTDKNGFIWACTDRYGLFKLRTADGSIAGHYDEESPAGKRLQTSGSNDVLLYNDSLVLIASGGLNILNTKTNTIQFADLGNEYRNISLNSILKDKQGYIWLAFTDGLCRMEFGKSLLLYFRTEDGILNNHFQLNAAAVLNDGRILLGTTTNLLVFDPTKIALPGEAVPVNISGFAAGDRTLQVDSLLKLNRVVLPYYDNTFSIDMTTFSFHNDHAILYMLEGLDEKWQVGKDNRVSFYRIPPGSYIFKAKSVSASGAESEIITRINIEIVPPFWKTWWFYSLLVLTGLTVFYLADRERLLRLRATQKLRTDIALSLHHDVKTALDTINLLSEMARIKADKDIPRSKELISQISEKSNYMMIAMDDMLWVLDPANDSMEKTILRMNEFIDALKNRHEAGIEIHIDEKVKGLKLDMKHRHGFFLIFKAALRCLVQYSGVKQTLVNIDLQKNGLCLKMLGSSSIINDVAVTAYMDEMKAHAADINAELDIQNSSAESSILLLMPVK